MRVLITGAAGFLGGCLVEALDRRGQQVRALVKAPGDPVACRSPRVERVVGDLLEPDTIFGATSGAEVVIHCAAALPGYGTDDQIWTVNVTGTANLLSACAKAGVERLVYVSTDSVYGDTDHTGATEETAIRPDYFNEGNYPKSKFAGEQLVMQYHRENRLPVTVVRPCLMYGPGKSQGNEVLKAWAARTTHLLLGGGRARMSLAFVEDVAEALILAATLPRAIGQFYNISDGESYSKREILLAIAQLTRRPKRLISIPSLPPYLMLRLVNPILRRLYPRVGSSFDPRRILFSINNHVVDCGKAQRELDYRPRVQLHEGLRRMEDWLIGPSREPRRREPS